MNKALKVTFGTMLAAALSSSAWAGFDEFLARSSVWVTGTYTESSNNGASYGDIVQSTSAIPNMDGEHRHAFVDPDMEFDYALGYSYHIPCSQSRFFVSYDHYNEHNEGTNNGVRNLGLSPATPLATGAYGYVNNHVQEFRIGLAHALNFNPMFAIDLSGYFEWDEFKRDINERIQGDNNGIATVRYRNTFESVKGWGPGVGGRVRSTPFACYSNWGVFAGGNTSLIWARNNYEARLVEYIPTDTTQLYGYDPETTNAVVGKVDVSFGINYTRKLRDLSCSMIDIALGVRYLNAFNVYKNGNAYQNPVYPSSNNVQYSANLGYPNDWGRVGPFLTFAIGGADA